MGLILFLILLLTVGIGIQRWGRRSARVLQTIQSLSQFHRFKSHPQAIVLGLCMVILMMPMVALANAPPPPPMTWFDFPGWSGSLDAVQVIQCGSEDCNQLQVIAQYGTCSVSGCVPQTQNDSVSDGNRGIQLSCHGTTCLMTEKVDPLDASPDRQLQLRVQSGDELLRSPMVTEPEQLEQAWEISRLGSSLAINFVDSWDRQGPPAWFWGKGLLLTLGTEAIILAAAMTMMNKNRCTWSRIFLSFGLMHLVTYPLVWIFPLGLMPFQSKISRLMALGVLFIAIIDVFILFFLRKTASWKLGLGTLLILPLAFFAIAVTAFLFSYGQPVPLTTGIPFNFALGITEGIIVVIEAMILTFLSNGALSLLSAGLLSLIMNLTSLLVGVILGYSWP